jgi:drug/metabolite transporter (DMT)-like permease
MTDAGAPPGRRLLPWIALLAVWVVWGSTYLAIRIVVREMPPLAAAGTRFLCAGTIMGLVALAVDRRHGWPAPRQWRDYALIGVLLLTVGNSLVMWAEKTVPSGIAALIVATVPLWILLLDGLRPGGQPWTARVWVGTVVGLAGVALVARPEGELDAAHGLAIVALQVATLSWTIGSLYAQQVAKRLPLASAAAVEMLAGSLVIFAASLLVGEDWSRMASASTRAWGGVSYLVAFGSWWASRRSRTAWNELPRPPSAPTPTSTPWSPSSGLARPRRASHARPPRRRPPHRPLRRADHAAQAAVACPP